jgi:hypothetical protein
MAAPLSGPGGRAASASGDDGERHLRAAMSQIQINSPRYAFVGLGAIVTSVLGFVLAGLADFHFRKYVPLPLGGLIVTAGLAITWWGTLRSARLEADEQENRLDAALAGWPPRTVEHLSPFDLGARPGSGPLPDDSYESPPEDEEVKDAVRNARMVLLVGPAGAGKTRAAYEAARSELAGAMVLAPLDGPALGTLVANGDRLGLASDVKVVLWLDSLERFFAGLDIDSLDRLTTWSARPGPLRRALDVARTRLTRRRARAEEVPQSETRVKVLATIREETLESALHGDGERAYVARRLLARMTIVNIAARPAPAPVPANATGAAGPGAAPLADRARGGERLARLGADYWDARLRPHASCVHPRPRVGRVSMIVLIGLFVVSCGLLALVVHSQGGWLEPPSLPSQAKAIESTLRECQTATGEPSVSGLSEGETWTLMVLSSGCPAPDSIRYYRIEHGLLKEQFTESPDSLASWRLLCLGAGGSPCRVPLSSGNAPALLGAFESSVTGEVLPLALYRSSDGRVHVYSPFLPRPPSGTLDASQPNGDEPLMLPLHPGAVASVDPRAPKSCARVAMLCSYPADFLAAEPAEGDRGALLLAGYVRSGSIYKPSEIDVRVYDLGYDRAHRLVLGPRRCLFFSHGDERASREIVKVKSSGEVLAKMRATWTPATRGEEAVIC